ncbi:MAG: peptide chain release factor 3 [Acidaminococcales bacterium]|jgi:peptide chain release factor 3|nr:peptide chain release factor 3 [Acidaminococcales bacterium]
MSLVNEIEQRRTFAIISHPDAGKTTLTEKLLLYGGAIHLAGTVKARKSQKYAVSDWMEIEKQRGISVASSVLQFNYKGCKVNVLDTPGHQDFSEDTYRTLTAADSAVMLIDAAKGVEEQTKKLFRVCRQRKLPVFTFVNKLDRYGRNPFDLMDEIEKVLGIRSCPLNWPIGVNGKYCGIYDRRKKNADIFLHDGSHGAKQTEAARYDPKDKAFREKVGEEAFLSLFNDMELLDVAGDPFAPEKITAGELTPMFFGSAMTNFGVEVFLEEFLRLSPPPRRRPLRDGTQRYPDNPLFSAFIFKIQANMNPGHRDRIAFFRICSGIFNKGMTVYHVQGGKNIRLAQPQQFLAQEREIVDKAYPGDILGIFDPGVFAIGDTFCDESENIRFEDFPVFPPEQFVRVQPKDTLKRKQFVKGIEQLGQEGAVQIFKQPASASESYIIGTVGALQMEVLAYRLRGEYGVELVITALSYSVARWLLGEEKYLSNMKGIDNGMLVLDKKGAPVVLVNNTWNLNWLIERNPQITFLEAPNAS